MADPTRNSDGVAVLIAAWRASDTVRAAVESALAQTPVREVVVIDDASDDGGKTVRAAASADDGSGRLRVIELPRNLGPAAARNRGISETSSPWVCVLDSDDYFLPDRICTLLAEADGRSDFVADDLLQVATGQPLSAGRRLLGTESTATDISLDGFVRGNIPKRGRQRRELGFLKPIMSRAFLERHGLSYDCTLRLGEDYDLYARALAAGARFRLLPSAGYVSVIRKESISGAHGPAELAALLRADDRLLASPGLSRAERKIIQAHRFSTRKRLSSMRFNRSLDAMQFGKAAGLLVRDPVMTPWIASGVLDALRKKLTRPVTQEAAR